MHTETDTLVTVTHPIRGNLESLTGVICFWAVGGNQRKPTQGKHFQPGARNGDLPVTSQQFYPLNDQPAIYFGLTT